MIDIREYKQKIENKNPLILNLSNFVTMNFMANTLLALGASPIMSVNTDDALELLNLVDGININIGTLDHEFIQLINTIAITNNKQKPLVFDPVGSGASTIRTKTSLDILSYISVLKGNASEISSLEDSSIKSKGVDSSINSNESIIAAQTLSKKYDFITIITGIEDYIINTLKVQKLLFGHPYMGKTTGMGCVLSSIITTFCTIEKDFYLASTIAISYYTLCGELAAKKSNLGDFQNYFIEMIYQPDFDYIQQKLDSL